jgi:hypothetical protein
MIFFEDSDEAEFVAHLDCLGCGVRRIMDTGHQMKFFFREGNAGSYGL